MSSAEQLGGFEAIVPVGTLTEYIGVQQAIVDESKWHLEQDSIVVTAVDAANVSMVRTTVHDTAFEHFEAGGGVLGIYLERLEDYATASKHGNVVNLSLDAETRKLRVERGRADFDMALIDPDDIRKEPDIPDLDLAVDVTVEGADLLEAVESAELVSDHLTLSTEGGALTAIADGDTDSVSVEIAGSVDAGEDVTAMYSLDYLEEIADPMPDDAAVRIRYGQDHPVKFSYETADGGIDVLNMLAPRIQSD